MGGPRPMVVSSYMGPGSSSDYSTSDQNLFLWPGELQWKMAQGLQNLNPHGGARRSSWLPASGQFSSGHRGHLGSETAVRCLSPFPSQFAFQIGMNKS